MKIVCLSLLLVAVLACPPGEYGIRTKFEIYCYQCTPGYFCPGDNTYNNCTNHYYAPYFGMTICMPCVDPNYKDSRWPHLYCLPNDTPESSQYVNTVPSFDRPSAHVLVPTAKELCYYNTGLNFDSLLLHPIYNGMLVVFESASEFSVVASSSYGKPSSDKHEFAGQGNVVSMVVPRKFMVDPPSIFSPWYFALQSATANNNVTIYMQPANATLIELTSPITDLYFEESTITQFFSIKAQQGARYNISVESIRVHPDQFYCYQYLYFDEQNQQEKYPNPYNAQVVSKDVAQNYTKTIYATLERQETNYMYFGVLTNCWSRSITMLIKVEQL